MPVIAVFNSLNVLEQYCIYDDDRPWSSMTKGAKLAYWRHSRYMSAFQRKHETQLNVPCARRPVKSTKTSACLVHLSQEVRLHTARLWSNLPPDIPIGSLYKVHRIAPQCIGDFFATCQATNPIIYQLTTQKGPVRQPVDGAITAKRVSFQTH